MSDLLLDLKPIMARLERVPVMSRERCIPRKEQARLARELFKCLGLKGISVTTPNYSMAQSVQVRIPLELPGPNDHVCQVTGQSYDYATYSEMPLTVPCKARHVRQQAARECIEQILARAFPNHGDRSDYQTDHFDYCWSFN